MTEEQQSETSESEQPKPTSRIKGSYLGVPLAFQLELACAHINRAFDGFGCYQVGSSLEYGGWRDIDVVMILEDDKFYELFPDTKEHNNFEGDTRWLLMTVAFSKWLSSQCDGLPVDFKFQPQTWANERHKGKKRSALGMCHMRMSKGE